MSTNLCCLCCKPCSSACISLQNDFGECNNIYEITVKYFDPMLLTEHLNAANSEKEGSVLCQNCWLHIQTFHDFHETVINGRKRFEEVILQQNPLEFKEQGISNFTKTSTEVQKEALKQSNKASVDNNLGYRSQSENDLQTLSKCADVDNKQIKKSSKSNRSLSPCSETATKIKNGKTNCLRKTNRIKPKVRQQNTLLNQNQKECSTNSCEDESVPKVIKSLDRHPALDKGREYDTFIAEWKSQLDCDVCNEVFPVFDLLKTHFKEKHNAKGFVKCCDRKFVRRCSLVEHIRLHINPEMHKCDICGKIIGSKYSLIHHKKTIHEESKKFKCNKCPKMFKQKQNLNCHLLTHVAGTKDFKCEDCGKAYVHELQLKKHIKLVHIDNRVCHQCGKTLHGIGALKNHLKEHNNIEKTKFPCDECGAELGSRITLKRHKASYHHDGTTVYVCGICGKVSSTERALRTHKNFVHEKERKFKCPNCDKAFKRTQNLQEHIATHTGEALYQCPQCPKSFKISSKYHEHRKKTHPIEWEEGRKNRSEKQKINFEHVKNQVVL